MSGARGKQPPENHVVPQSREAWRAWLESNHATSTSVWLVYFKKGSDVPSVSYSDAVDEALCFGWIDSRVESLDEARYMQYFSVRKPASNWSALNKRKLETLIAQGRMAPAGRRAIEAAKANGSWTRIDSSERLEVPADLNAALRSRGPASEWFAGLSRTNKRVTLEWINAAKREATRAERVRLVAEAAEAGRLAGPAAQQQARRGAAKRPAD